MADIYNGVLFDFTKEGNTITFYNIDKLCIKHITKSKHQMIPSYKALVKFIETETITIHSNFLVTSLYWTIRLNLKEGPVPRI